MLNLKNKVVFKGDRTLWYLSLIHIFLIVRDGWVTDTSFTNVVFEDVVGGLYTPDTYLLEGTRRQGLLDAGKIQACPIRVEDIGHFQRVLLVNAMIGLEDEISVPVVNIMK